MIGLLRSPWAILAIAAVLLATHAGVAAKAYEAGSVRESSRWQAQEIRRQEQAAEQYRALQAQLAAREAALAEKQQEGADGIAEIKVVQLPARVEIRRQIVERAVYRECRADQRLLDIVNAARAGRPYAAPVPAADGGMPGDAAAGG